MGSVTIDGISRLNANYLQGKPISTTTPATSSIYQYDGTQWSPLTSFSGLTFTSPVFSGTATSTGEIDFTESSESNNIITGKKTGDAFTRWSQTADGRLSFGAGTGAADTRIYRSAANTLTVDDASGGAGNIILSGQGSLKMTTLSNTADIFAANFNEANNRFSYTGTGAFSWGPGSTTQDIVLKRNAAGVLQLTDGTGTLSGTGGLKFGNSTTSYTAASLDYNEGPTTVSTTFGGAFANTAFNLVYTRIGNTITCRWVDIQAACTAASQITAAVGQIPARFCPAATTRKTTLGANAGAVQDQPVGMDFKHDGSITIYLKPTSVNFTSGAGLCGPYASEHTWTFV
jgi:hypothetical protein